MLVCTFWCCLTVSAGFSLFISIHLLSQSLDKHSIKTYKQDSQVIQIVEHNQYFILSSSTRKKNHTNSAKTAQSSTKFPVYIVRPMRKTIKEKSYSSTVFPTKLIYVENNKNLKLHIKIHSRFTSKELLDYYAAERESERRFRYTLSVKHNRSLLKTLFPNPDFPQNDRITDQMRVKLEVSDTFKTILIYHGSSIHTEENFRKENCNVRWCRITDDLSEFATADVVYFNGAVPFTARPRGRSTTQVWLMYQLESAFNYPTASFGAAVNWTATYRRDSVVSAPYARFAPFLGAKNLLKTPLRNYAAGKTKIAAWFVSSCHTSNGRMDLAMELSNHIQLDIFGTCGSYKCSRSTSRECFEKLNREYKFYLSFENSNCKDYVSEKLFWNALSNNIVPVVMGANTVEYKRIAPPNSYIHVDDFNSPKELAEYLHFLNRNDKYYNDYFLWKGTGRLINTKFMCRLCAMAHLAPHFPWWYPDIEKWWNGDGICRTGSSWNTNKISAFNDF